MFSKLVNILGVPIIFLNIGGGIVGGIWLAILGEWRLLGIGIFLFTSHWILSFLMLPGLPLSGLAVYLREKKNPLGHIVGFLSQFYTNLLIVASCVFAFLVCSRFYMGNIDFIIIFSVIITHIPS